MINPYISAIYWINDYKNKSLDSYFTTFLGLTGTFVFAISGIRRASGKQIDWFGAYLIGLVTATGGGTVRDLLLGVNPFWMMDSTYFLITGIALLTTLVFKNKILKWQNTIFLFDTLGLGLFTIVGITKSVEMGLPFWVCIAMGAITSSLGGVIRDVLLNEVPLLLRKDIYALACIAGGVVYFICLQFHVLANVTELIAALTVIFVRIIALKYHIHLPVLKSIKDNTDKT